MGLCSSFPIESISSFHSKGAALSSEETNQTEYSVVKAHSEVKLKKCTLVVWLSNFSHLAYNKNK